MDKAISAQLKAEAPAAAVVKKVQAIVWSEKPYLKRLKPNAEKLLQKAKNQRDQAAASASSQSNATSTRKQASASSASQKMMPLFMRPLSSCVKGLSTAWGQIVAIPWLV
ncbi:hypothetical protein [Lacticaseibacillus saniviri]|uniref:hypothetical protein n=1 Tax=Lacticaseibacillus saniviri TaxID=931533 RepID=UPI0006CF91A5|nr:hypothetical protein [Lacticaseibacillus saniviri]